LDGFWGDLSYCLRLLIGFDVVEVDHGGRLTAMGSVWAIVVVEGEKALLQEGLLQALFWHLRM
jgi:hypothetical protein